MFRTIVRLALLGLAVFMVSGCIESDRRLFGTSPTVLDVQPGFYRGIKDEYDPLNTDQNAQRKVFDAGPITAMVRQYGRGYEMNVQVRDGMKHRESVYHFDLINVREVWYLAEVTRLYGPGEVSEGKRRYQYILVRVEDDMMWWYVQMCSLVSTSTRLASLYGLEYQSREGTRFHCNARSLEGLKAFAEDLTIDVPMMRAPIATFKRER